jgi:hypothetical protein
MPESIPCGVDWAIGILIALVCAALGGTLWRWHRRGFYRRWNSPPDSN